VAPIFLKEAPEERNVYGNDRFGLIPKAPLGAELLALLKELRKILGCANYKHLAPDGA
jgi:hypothetical protein